ncbi:hypothetical protein I4U23_000259 [Adineta vaga]|nr:hypothetical protein I4U23_000259 [Adineta vaga]
MHSTIIFTLCLALMMMNVSNARRVQLDNDDDNNFELTDVRARSFLDTADDYEKRADSNCVLCSKLTRSRCCAPNICVKKLLHNECIKVKPGK